MESLLSKLYSSEYSTKNAIILCDHNKILQKLTFEDLRIIATRLIDFFKPYFTASNQCIGLIMETNIYIPSLILSFQVYQYSFIFLEESTTNKTAEKLNIQWIISFNKIYKSTQHYELINSLMLSNGNNLQLWKCSKKNDNLIFKDIFCVMQTSGSTGDSKIIKIPYLCIENNAVNLNKFFNVTESDVIYWGTPLTFDPSLIEFLLALLHYATLLIVPKYLNINPSFLYNALFKIGNTTFLQTVPSLFLRFTSKQIADMLLHSPLKILALGGEQFPVEILNHPRKPSLAVYNLYGVTELSCWATIFKIEDSFSSANEIPLGSALDDVFITLYNENEEIFNGNYGEITVGSNTRYCLLSNEEDTSYSTYSVKTGDLGEIHDGNIYFKGRKNRIFKRLGHKVNLDNIESTIATETCLQCKVIYSNKYRKLLSFVQIDKIYDKISKVKLLDKLRVKLLKILKDYEFPDFIEALMHFPLNSHGKICHTLLEKYYQDCLDCTSTELKENHNIFTDILHKYLPIDKYINGDQLNSHSFIDLGGNSMLGIQIISDFEDHVQAHIPDEFINLLFNEQLTNCLEYLKVTKLKRKSTYNYKAKKKLKVDLIDSDLVQWKYDMKGCVDSSPVGFANSQFYYVCAGSFSGIFVILDKYGQEIFKHTFSHEIEARPYVSPCGNLIYIGCGNGIMYCIDVNTKNIIWEYSTLEKIKSAACLLESCVVFGSYDSHVYCLTKKTGTLIWKIQLNGGVKADIIYSEKRNILYTSTFKGVCYGLNSSDGTICWHYQCSSPIFGSPCIMKNDTIWITVTGKLYCISSDGGVQWTFDVNCNVFSSIINELDSIYFTAHDCCFYELNCSEGSCKIVKKLELVGEMSSTPCLYEYNGNLYSICVCNNGILCIIDLNIGTVKFQCALPNESFSAPFIFQDRIYVGCRDNNLYCIDFVKAITS